MKEDQLKVGLVQMAPVWMEKQPTLDKIAGFIEQAGREDCRLVAFGEAILPGYPFWSELTGGADFNSEMQKDFYSQYLEQAVHLPSGDLDDLCQAAKAANVHTIVGTIERAADRGGHSLYCSLVYIDAKGEIRNVHRKLVPTYEERLNWAPGDGHGLRTFPLGSFTLGALNCWENWMPLSRAALYGMGEDLHVAIWPGSVRNTSDITRFIALESRAYVLSVSGLMKKSDFPKDTLHAGALLENCPDVLTDGGSCIAAPDGSWLVEPVIGKEGLITAVIDHREVRRERQNLDVAGHYSRPDVTRLTVNRIRQQIVDTED